MKKYIQTVAVILFILICFSGCASDHQLPKDDELPYNTAPIDTKIPYVSFHADWPYYSTVEEIVDASTNVFTGKIINISFDIIDMTTGKSDKSDLSESRHRMLYTVYTIEVNENHKGENDKTEQICVMGGIVGFDDEMQYNLMQESGLSTRYSGIPILENSKKLNIGETYLFSTHRSMISNRNYVINMEQFALSPSSESATLIQKQCSDLAKNNKE